MKPSSSAPFDAILTKASTVCPTTSGDILGIALDVGSEMLKCGGEVHRVEDTVARICFAYGAVDAQIFAITSLIIAEIRMPDDTRATGIRRVYDNINHLARLEELNALSRVICHTPLSEREVQARLADIRRFRPIPEWLCYLGAILATGGFAIFFGGTVWDGLAAAAVSVPVTFLRRKRTFPINEMARAMIASFIAGMLGILCATIGFGTNEDKILIGAIMLEIPGLAFGNALRDLLCGETLAGTMRFVQALLQALMVALGYTTAILLSHHILGV